MIPEKSYPMTLLKPALIIIIGVSGSGKSTLAQALAAHYGYEYLDGDDFHSPEARALMAAGTPLTDEHRAPWVAAIKQRLEQNAQTYTSTVLAFSGLKQKHRNELRINGARILVLYLKGNKDTIQRRMSLRKGHFMPASLLDSQFASLEPPIREPDVRVIDIKPRPDLVLEQAKTFTEKYLPLS